MVIEPPKNEYILTYQRSSKAAGYRFAFGFFGNIGTILLGFKLIRLFGHDNDNPPLNNDGPPLILIVFFLLFFGVLSLYMTIRLLRNSGTFLYRISQQRIECFSPDNGFVESYSIEVADIVGVGQDPKIRDPSDADWCIWDNKGSEFVITANYGNPVFEIIEVIRGLRPDLVIK